MINTISSNYSLSSDSWQLSISSLYRRFVSSGLYIYTDHIPCYTFVSLSFYQTQQNECTNNWTKAITTLMMLSFIACTVEEIANRKNSMKLAFTYIYR